MSKMFVLQLCPFFFYSLFHTYECRASKVAVHCVFLQKTLLVPMMLLSGVWSIAQKWMSWWLAAGIKQSNSGIPELPVMQEPSPSLKRYVLHSRCSVMHPGTETSHRTLVGLSLWSYELNFWIYINFFLKTWCKCSILKDWYSECITIFDEGSELSQCSLILGACAGPLS